MRTVLKYWLALLALTLFLAGPAAADDDDLLPPEQAFALKVTALDAVTLRAEWNVAKGYYLYKERFSFSTNTPGVTLGAPKFPAGKIKQD